MKRWRASNVPALPACTPGLSSSPTATRVEQPVAQDDWTFFAHLVDDAGHQWGGDTFFTYPSGQWEAGETIALRLAAPIWDGAPPGDYTLAVGAYSPSLDARLSLLNERGQMSGTTIKVGPLAVARAPARPGRRGRR